VSFLALLVLVAEPDTASIDKARFAGRCYEHARMPSFFQKGCTDTTATYTLNADGELDVVNRCLKDGAESSVKGTMWISDPNESGKLTLQLFWPIRSQMWVLEHDDAYEYVLLGTPDESKAWVFTRHPAIDEALSQSLISKLEQRGYPVKQLVQVSHSADAGT
jgi:apolipoprotein D and lipocalin family protein